MNIYLKNTLSGDIEKFKPLNRKEVGMYNCGPTVYNKAHIGNISSYIFADTLRRLFENQGYKVNQVINITDVGHLTNDSDDGEDKMEKASLITGNSAKDISKKYTDLFFEDLNKLNIDISKIKFPKATDHIEEQIDLIKKLDEVGMIYQTSDGVYFNTAKYPEYGKLGNINIEKLKEGARVELNIEKKNPSDFALWKLSPKGSEREQEWDSPWGIGFPGWHIECSAMSRKYLGETFDIHTGGVDHIPTHHNNEIAQSEGAFGKPLANYWMHFNHIMLNGEKISKSVGNVLYVSDLEEKGYAPAVFRYWFLTSHYSTPANFTWESLSAAKSAFLKLKRFVIKNYVSDKKIKVNKKYYKLALKELNHDLGTPEAIAVLWELLKDKEISDLDKTATILEVDKFLGLDLMSKFEETIIPQNIRDMLLERNDAKDNKNYSEADRIRDNILNEGYKIQDIANGIEVISPNGSKTIIKK
jgi:cysteinyl-tRNA synthetase